MRLKIINLDKIIRIWKDVHITGVRETSEHYEFICRRSDWASGHTFTVKLRRKSDGIGTQGAPTFYFVGHTACVTTDWFSDMDNAVEAISSRLLPI